MAETTWLQAGVLLLSLYAYRFFDKTGMYSNIMSWQFTICSLHIAPIVALRTARLPRGGELLICLGWLLISWGCRRGQRSMWSLGFLFLEGLFATMELDRSLLEALLVLQVVIAVGAWGGMIAASFSKQTIVPMDRHLHKGLRHLLLDPGARRCLAHELASHLVAQATFGTLLFQVLRGAPQLPEAVWVASWLLAGYVTCVLVAAAAVAPHELPYMLGRLPRALRWPLPLPEWLLGQGAAGSSIELLTLPWWMQIATKASAKAPAKGEAPMASKAKARRKGKA